MNQIKQIIAEKLGWTEEFWICPETGHAHEYWLTPNCEIRESISVPIGLANKMKHAEAHGASDEQLANMAVDYINSK